MINLQYPETNLRKLKKYPVLYHLRLLIDTKFGYGEELNSLKENKNAKNC